MRFKYAEKLQNRDEVEVRVDGKWSRGYVLGSIQIVGKEILIPVQSERDGYIQVGHRDVR